MKKLLLTLSVFILCFASSNALNLSSKDTVCVKNNPNPIFVGKRNVIKTIEVVSNGDLKIENISVKIYGASHKEINDIKLYIRNNGKEKDIASAKYFWGKFRMKSNFNIPKGKQTLYIKANVNPNLSINSKIRIDIKNVRFNKDVVLESSQNDFYRVGITVRDKGQDRVHTYRIPGLVYTKKGTLIAVYDVRHNSSIDLQGDIDVGISRSFDKGQTWQPMQIIMDMGKWGEKPEKENGIGDPSILIDDKTGRIWVAALWAYGKPGKMIWHSSEKGLSPEETGQFMLAYSDDDGATWSSPINITEMIKKPSWNLFFQGPGMGITMKDGTLVFPAQFKDEKAMPYSTIIFSKDKGKTWNVGSGAKSNTTEAQVVELSDGSLMLNMRDNRGGARSICTTTNLGKTWTEHPTSRKALIEPVCQASIIRIKLPNGKKGLAFFNPNDTKRRANMTIKISDDEGNTWKYEKLIHSPDCFGYSCLTQIDDNTIGVLYEGASSLLFQQIDINDVIENSNNPSERIHCTKCM